LGEGGAREGGALVGAGITPCWALVGSASKDGGCVRCVATRRGEGVVVAAWVGGANGKVDIAGPWALGGISKEGVGVSAPLG
jgi:hypothetical protein